MTVTSVSLDQSIRNNREINKKDYLVLDQSVVFEKLDESKLKGRCWKTMEINKNPTGSL